MMKMHNVQTMLIVTVAVIGLNLRPFMTSIGPVTSPIRSATGLNLQGIALLTLLPMLLMGVLAFLAPKIQQFFGERRAVLAALGLIAIGCGLRLFAVYGEVLIATAAIIGLGVAIIQAIFPSIIKKKFSQHVSSMMGLYSAMLMGGGAVGALVSPLVYSNSHNWKLALSVFALPAVAAFVFAFRFLNTPSDQAKATSSLGALIRQPRTWLLIFSFGLVNGGYTSVVAWLAPAYQERGWSSIASGHLLVVLTLSQAIMALVLPFLSRRHIDRRKWLAFALVLQLIGFIGLAFWPDHWVYVWAICLGAGLGGCFALLMVVVLDHLDDPAHAGQLSALMQGGGFLLAALSPWLLAIFHESTGSYQAGWVWHVLVIMLMMILILKFNPKHYAHVIQVNTKK